MFARLSNIHYSKFQHLVVASDDALLVVASGLIVGINDGVRGNAWKYPVRRLFIAKLTNMHPILPLALCGSAQVLMVLISGITYPAAISAREENILQTENRHSLQRPSACGNRASNTRKR